MESNLNKTHLKLLLAELEELKEEGLITKEKYDSRKKELMLSFIKAPSDTKKKGTFQK
jgi:DNA-binding HxlR family transcriptional regulator